MSSTVYNRPTHPTTYFTDLDLLKSYISYITLSFLNYSTSTLYTVMVLNNTIIPTDYGMNDCKQQHNATMVVLVL